MRTLLISIIALASIVTGYSQTRGVSYDSSPGNNTNVIQTVHQRFHSITNLAATASEIAGYDANKKLGSFTAAATRALLSVPVFDLTDPGAVNIFPFWDDTGNEVDWTSNTALLTLLGIDSNDSVTFGTVTATTLDGAGGGITYTGSGNNGNLATSVNTLQELNDAVDNLPLGGGGSAPTGTMVNSGGSTQYALTYHTDLTGTNTAASLIMTDSTLTNLYAGGVRANVLVLTNISESLSNIGLGTEDSPTFATVTVGTTNVAGALAAAAKLSGGNTIGGAQLLSEGASIQLDAASSADGAFSGTTRTGTAGATLAFGDLIVLDPTDSRWELADANSASAADGDARGIIGICVQAAAADGSATTILLQGIVRADAVFPSFTINAPIYVSETAGDVTNTSPTTEDNVVRILGAAWTVDEIYFSPSYTWVVYDAP
jgi:hypothetical protein